MEETKEYWETLNIKQLYILMIGAILVIGALTFLIGYQVGINIATDHYYNETCSYTTIYTTVDYPDINYSAMDDLLHISGGDTLR